MKKYFCLLFVAIVVWGIATSALAFSQIDPGLIAHWDFSQINNDVVVDKIGGYNGENEGGILTNDGYSGPGMIFNFYRDSSMHYGGGVRTITSLPAMDKFTLSYRIKFDDLPQGA